MESYQQYNETKIALVVEGGAMRGIFSTGVLDAFLEADFNPFEWCIGVSAGATNIASYLAKMPGRNYHIYTKYSLKRQFISVSKFLRGKHFMDLDWLWEETIKDIRLDLDQIEMSPSHYYVGVTNMDTGCIDYIYPRKENLENVIKASSAIPILYRHAIDIDGTPYVDGGVADPIPVCKAVDLGAKTVVVIRSKKKDYRMKTKKAQWLRWIMFHYPKLYQAMLKRGECYNQQVDFCRTKKEGVQIIEICPPDDFQTGRLTRDKAILDADYLKGIEAGKRFLNLYNKKAMVANQVITSV